MNYNNQFQSHHPQMQTEQKAVNEPSVIAPAFPERFSYKAHGGTAAIEIKPTITSSGFHTVTIEGASILTKRTSNAPSTYDWQNRVIFQITKSELPLFCMVFGGMIKKIEFKGHKASGKTKNFSVENQVTNLFANLFQMADQGENRFANIPIGLSDALQMGHIALVQYCTNYPTLSTGAALSSFERMAKFYNQKN